MKVEKVEAIVISADLPEPIMDATYSFSSRSSVIVKIFTDQDIVGIGEAGCIGGSAIVTKTIVEKELSNYIVGKDPLQTEKLWDEMYRGSFQHGQKGAIIAGISGIDIALWDIKGKISGLPIYKLLGAYSSSLVPYASGGFYSPAKGISALVEETKRYVSQGFKAIKIKIGRLSPREDLERVDKVREAIGDDILLMVDANSKYLPSAAITIGRKLEKYNVFFFEDPIWPDDLEGYIEVSRALDMPIAGGENEFCTFGFKRLIQSHAVDIIQPDVTWSGGFTECKKIAALARAWNMPCVPHCFSSAVALISTMHLVAAISNGIFVEFDQNYNPLREELILEEIKLENGSIELPEKPGLGMTLNENFIKKNEQWGH